MEIFADTQSNEATLGRELAAIARRNSALYQQLKISHEVVFRMIWANGRFTPQEIFDGFGSGAAKLFALSAQIQQLLAAANANYEPITPPYEYTINADGTVTVGLKK